MGRILAIDYGKKRVGIAVSDPERIIAQVLEPALKNNSSLLENLGRLLEKYQAEELVIGLPRALSGELGEMGREVEKFSETAAKRFGIPVRTVDERFSTRQAGSVLMAEGAKRAEKKAMVDNLSAQSLLQGFLDSSKGD